MPKNQQRTPEEIQQDLHHKLGQVLSSTTSQIDKEKIDLTRYRNVRRFFAGAFLHVIWWDIILNRPVLNWFRSPPLPRWQKITRNYREMAVEMGGVLIKLGQFLSTRVDILPVEITEELAGLQDEVPPERVENIITQIEEDFNRPLSDIFEWLSPQALGAASLAQAHLARLKSGQEVVVKVLRPGVDILVATDLAAISLAFRWLKYYKRVSIRVDLDWLSEEFTTVTLNELDFQAEGHNIEHFAADFADNPYVYVPKVYWKYSAARTLSLENVGYIKIGDIKSLKAAGIDPSTVADTLYNLYMHQVFVSNFVHVDPHPGNLFIKPLPHPDEIKAGITAFGLNDHVPYKADRSFQVVFVDFGMVAVIPKRLRVALREYAIGFGTRDAHRMVQSYVKAGTLLPGADLKRLEEAHEAMFERFWGISMGQMHDVAMKEAEFFLREYRDLIYEAPFQFQVDMLFVLRAIGILSGMATNLDPDFDPWTKAMPFAEQFARDELKQDWQGWLQEIVILGQFLFKMPSQIDRVLTQAGRGTLTVQTSLAPDTRKRLLHLEQSISQLTLIVMSVGLLISGANLYDGTHFRLGQMLMGLSFLFFVWSLLKKM